MEELPNEITVLTLNCWGLKYLSKLRTERLSEIGRQLAALDPAPNIVALQECWCQEDYRSIRRDTRFILPYGKFYYSGVFGGGLAILSKWPIEESTMFRYPLNGRPTAFWRGDWYVGKGVACAKIRYGPGLKHVVEVFNTHTHAAYSSDTPDTYLTHRTAQAWEVSKLFRGAAERGHLVLGMGDFNMIPSSLAHRLVTANAPVRDVWRVLHPDAALGPAHDAAEMARRRPIPTAAHSLAENGATSDSVLNTWRWEGGRQKKLLAEAKRAAGRKAGGGGGVEDERGVGRGRAGSESDPGDPFAVPLDTIDGKAKRLDYIFASTGDVPALGGGWVVRSARVALTERHPSLGVSLSDHFAVSATLVFHARSSSSSSSPSATKQQQQASGAGPDHDAATSDSLSRGTYLQSPAGSTSSSQRGSGLGPGGGGGGGGAAPSADAQLDGLPDLDGAAFVPSTAYDEVLGALQRYTLRERAQRRWRGLHFGAAVAVAVACHVGVWFVPRNWVAFVLLLVCSLGLVAGTVDGLLALLFFGAEMRALREFEWEMRNTKAAAMGGPPGLVEEEEARDKGW